MKNFSLKKSVPAPQGVKPFWALKSTGFSTQLPSLGVLKCVH